MPNKQKGKSNPKNAKRQNTPRPKKQTPFADSGEIVGNALGNFFGYPMLKGVGRWLGSGIGRILGSGDYTTTGPRPKYNVLTSDVQVPQFSSTRQTNIVCHREYLGDIQGTSGFNITQYPINPGLSQTFPWLSTVAENYQEYRIHGMIFEFKSMLTDYVTNGAPGMVIMATGYNPDAPAYTTKQDMENSEFAVAAKPTINLIHGIECAPHQSTEAVKYIRTGAVASGLDLKSYDLGVVQVATQGNPNQALGELWVSYCVEFFKPVLPNSVGGNVLSYLTHRTNFSVAFPYGQSVVNQSGTLGVTTTPQTLSWYGQPGNKYVVYICWLGSTAASFLAPGFTTSGLTYNQLAVGPGTINGVSTTCAVLCYSYTCGLTSPGTVSLTVGTTGTLPTGTTDVTIFVSSMDPSAAY